MADDRAQAPFFTIIIPMYNREWFIARAINSCLNQDFEDFEVIVVDDGSTDGSVEVVRGFADPRIRLTCLPDNRGVSVARNAGIDQARGEWVVPLDSDDELTPGALLTMHLRAGQVAADIARLRFMCRMDSGRASPDPPLRDEVWEYRDWLKWQESMHGYPSETFSCVRRSTFQITRYPEPRTIAGGNEALYHLDFAQHFRQRTFPDVCRLYHQDAENQLCKADMQRSLLVASDHLHDAEVILARHGAAMAHWAPTVYRAHVSGTMTLAFLAGRRVKGWAYAMRCLRANPFSLRTWSVLISGSIAPKLLAWLKAVVQRGAPIVSKSRPV